MVVPLTAVAFSVVTQCEPSQIQVKTEFPNVVDSLASKVIVLCDNSETVLHAAYSKHYTTPRYSVRKINILGNNTAKNGEKLPPPNMLMTIEKENGCKKS